jgi:DNA-binding NarL/FixJ family response regulator
VSGAAGQHIRLILIESHANVRNQIRALLASEPTFALIANLQSGVEAASEIRRLEPDLVVMDLQLPDTDGLTLTRVIKQLQPDSCVVLLISSLKYRKSALDCGVTETIVKSDLISDFIPTLKRVCAASIVQAGG